MTTLGVVVPCYNEKEVLPETGRRLTDLLLRLVEKKKISPDSRIYFVDDGSTDGTWGLIEAACQYHPTVSGIKLAHNVGHQNALLAGLLAAEGDVLVSIDADLQDDINAIESMIDEFHNGNEIVYGVRKKRDTDTAFKRITARAFYHLLQIMGVNVVNNHADFRLLGRRAVDSLREFGEVNLFLRGIVSLLGYNSSIVYYDRAERMAGISKYPFRRMLALAIDGLTSFTVAPLRIITLIGLLVFLISTGMGTWALYSVLFTDNTIPGWASTVLPIYLIGGVQLFSLGVLGEYIGKIYGEVKRRPRFIIEKKTSP